jgi:glycosyltransferase involved in cell wall biosynthesis
MGHEVTLFACGDSKTSAELKSCIELPMRELDVKMPFYYEIQSIAMLLEKADEYDIIHNHVGFLFLPFAKYLNIPVVTTLHGAFVNEEETSFYKQHKDMPFISISNYQRKGAPYLNYISTVYNGIDVEKYTFQEKPDTEKPYLLFLGRISREKGVHLTIQLALETGYDLIIAGKISDADREYYENDIKQHIDGKKVVYVGEVGHEAKVKLLKDAYAAVHTVTWPEPFGLVMAESMACGTPVLALRDGSIPEVIKNGITGFVEDNIDDLIKRVEEIKYIDRKQCRLHVSENFTSAQMVKNYLSAYQKLLNKTECSPNAQLNFQRHLT